MLVLSKHLNDGEIGIKFARYTLCERDMIGTLSIDEDRHEGDKMLMKGRIT